MKTLAVLQPGYLPWLGFFDQMARADVFVIYDDVQFDKNGWRNRNRIKSGQGQPTWLTVPVHCAGFPLVNEVTIDHQHSWARKHLRSIELAYAKAPFRNAFLPEIKAILESPWDKLVDLDMAIINKFRSWLKISTECHLSSSLNVHGHNTERLVALCQHFGVTHYLTGNAAEDYLEVGQFEDIGVEVVWQNYVHPVYHQVNGDFVSHLSTLDLILNEGEEASRFFQKRTQ